jgi:hypothetical protein
MFTTSEVIMTPLFNDVTKLIKETDLTLGFFYNLDVAVEKFNKLGEIKCEYVTRCEGSEDVSENWTVFKFTFGYEVTYIKFDGYYASYDGETFTGMFEVSPKEKTIIVYE